MVNHCAFTAKPRWEGCLIVYAGHLQLLIVYYDTNEPYRKRRLKRPAGRAPGRAAAPDATQPLLNAWSRKKTEKAHFHTAQQHCRKAKKILSECCRRESGFFKREWRISACRVWMDIWKPVVILKEKAQVKMKPCKIKASRCSCQRVMYLQTLPIPCRKFSAPLNFFINRKIYFARHQFQWGTITNPFSHGGLLGLRPLVCSIYLACLLQLPSTSGSLPMINLGHGLSPIT